MYRIGAAALEMGAAAVILLPVLLVVNAVYWHDLRKTAGYFVFACYLAAVCALVGLPGLGNFHVEPNLNILPFAGMAADAKNAALNVLLFVPLGLLAPLLWPDLRSLKRMALLALAFAGVIEILQIFTFRASDINDLITNTLGAVIGCGLVRLLPWRADNPTRELWVLAGLVLAVMMFLQPPLAGLLWQAVM